MKKLMLVAMVLLFTFFLMIGLSEAVSLGLKGLWDRNPELDLAGYNLYRTDGVRTKVNLALIGVTLGTTANPFIFSVTVPDGTEGTLRFRLTAVDTTGHESLDSNEAPYSYDEKAPGSPTGLGVFKQ